MALRPLALLRTTHYAILGTLRAHKVVFLAIGLLLVLGVGFLVLWIDGGRNRFLPKNFGVVEPGLIYRSGQIHGAILEDVLKEHHIQTVIDVSGDSGRSHEDAELEIVARLGVEKHTFDGLDGHGLGPIESYANAFTTLVEERRRGRPVLVHCRAGSERTGALISLYRVLVEGWSPEKAYAEYLRYRHRPPKSNVLFDQLNAHMDAFLAKVVASGALESMPDPAPRLGPPTPPTTKP